MKTFEEAAQTTMKKLQDKQSSRAAIAEMREAQARYAGIGEEAKSCPVVVESIITMAEMVNRGFPLQRALFNMFMNGVVTGMEMEKP